MRQLMRLLVLATIIVNLMYPGGVVAQANSRFFPETGRTGCPRVGAAAR